MAGLPRKRAYTEMEKGSREHLDMSLIFFFRRDKERGWSVAGVGSETIKRK